MPTPTSEIEMTPEQADLIEGDEIAEADGATEDVATTGGFADMNLSPVTLEALARAGYATPSPIQEHLVPPALAGRDCLGNAPTGTGKTAAFLLPILEAIDDTNRSVQVLILAPTRELVVQICVEFDRLSLGRRCRAAAVVGGESIVRQQRLLGMGVQLVAATPGRLMDLMGRNAIRLNKVKIVVLDEADQMLDIGFRPAVEEILQSVPTERQTMLLSATMPPGVRELAHRYLNDPADVRLISENEDATIPAIRQSFIMVDSGRKFELLVGLMNRDKPNRAIVFCRTKRGADRVGLSLRAEGFKADTMHGNLSQAQRNRVLHAFRSGRLNALVATDVVGRGIDVQAVTHVINFDLPEDPSHYVHRIGRTGRMGNDGIAFSFVCPDQGKMLDDIERCISRELECDQVEGIPSPPRPANRQRRPQSGGQGNRRGPYRGGGRPGSSNGGSGPRTSNGLGVGARRRRSAQGAGR